MFPLDNNDVELIRKVANVSRSRICGFIMYTKADAFVAKVLKDEDYWNALYAASGANWPIFAIKPLSTRRKLEDFESEEQKLRYVSALQEEPDVNRKYLQFFKLPSSEELPCFIAFYVNDRSKVEQLVCEIKGNSVEEVYKSIREIVDSISNAEKQILPEYKQTESVFREVAKNLDALCLRRTMADGLPAILMSVRSLFRLIKLS